MTATARTRRETAEQNERAGRDTCPAPAFLFSDGADGDSPNHFRRG